MSFRALQTTVLCLMLMPGMAVPSEGLKYAAAYMCDPQRMTAAIVQACVQKDVTRSGQYATALEAWTDRNRGEISRLKGECAAEFRKLSSSDAEFQEMMVAVNRLNDEAIAAMRRDAEKLTFCGEMLIGIETGKSDLKNFFPSK